LAKAWTVLAAASAASSALCFDTLANRIKEIGCVAEGAPYVIRGLLGPSNANRARIDVRFEDHPSQEAAVAAAFLDKEKCPGARGLSEEDRARLQEIRDRGLKLGLGATP
jgi:hypothetical protein